MKSPGSGMSITHLHVSHHVDSTFAEEDESENSREDDDSSVKIVSPPPPSQPITRSVSAKQAMYKMENSDDLLLAPPPCPRMVPRVRKLGIQPYHDG